MSETTKDTDKKKKPLSLSRPGRLEIKKTVEQGQIRQSFSHGRSKAVTVEVLRKRTYAATESGGMAEVKPGDGAAAEVQAKDLGDMLTSGEQAVRARVLEDAKQDDERRKIEAVARAKEEADKAEEAKNRAEEAAQAAAAAAPPPDPDVEAPAKPARTKAKPAPVSVEEIGRASCRERV